uniref:Uncharacterized protein n=1 Tax=Timema monikensis TaxID=170555 RepID=A0A7R9HRC3_9NEOP|nr:unnamed protein product [Timema monikensis]
MLGKEIEANRIALMKIRCQCFDGFQITERDFSGVHQNEEGTTESCLHAMHGLLLETYCVGYPCFMGRAGQGLPLQPVQVALLGNKMYLPLCIQLPPPQHFLDQLSEVARWGPRGGALTSYSHDMGTYYQSLSVCREGSSSLHTDDLVVVLVMPDTNVHHIAQGPPCGGAPTGSLEACQYRKTGLRGDLQTFVDLMAFGISLEELTANDKMDTAAMKPGTSNNIQTDAI